MKAERILLSDGVVSFVVRKETGDLARENAWWLFSLLLSAVATFNLSHNSWPLKVSVRETHLFGVKRGCECVLLEAKLT